MNKRLISYILGWVMLIEGATMLLPTVVGVIYHEWPFLKFFLSRIFARIQKARQQHHVP